MIPPTIPPPSSQYSTHLWPTQQCTAVPMTPHNMPQNSGDTYSSLSTTSSRRKNRARNCMIGWMLAVTAVGVSIILMFDVLFYYL
jgi:hypothetical protein